MSRTFNDIQQSILDAKAQVAELNALEVTTSNEQSLEDITSTSKVSIWRLFVWIVSFAIWVHEQIVSKNAENSRPHNIKWYREQSLNFLDGLELVWQNGQYSFDTTGVLDLEDRKIIDRCAVIDSNDGQLMIKIATDNAGVLQPVTELQYGRFSSYIQLIKDAGNAITIVNAQPDNLKITLTVEVDDMIIDLETGRLLSTTDEVYPVEEAIKSYLANLEFNGAFIKEFFRDYLQKAEGVKLPLIDVLQWKFAAFPFVDIAQGKIPESGYFVINPEDLIINYVKYDMANY